MTLLELKNIVDRVYQNAHDPSKIMVQIPTHKVDTVGHMPCTSVESAHMGIDWESRSFLIRPVCTLREIDRAEIAEIQKKYSDLGWTSYKISNMQTQLRNLKEENDVLKEQLQNFGN